MTLEWPKWLAIGSKWAHSTCLGIPNGLGSFLEKHIFDPFLTQCWSQNSPFSRHFGTLEGPKWAAVGSKWAHFTCLGTPNGLGSFLEKHTFDPFLVPRSPFSRHFGTLGRPKRATTSSKCAENISFDIPCGPRSFLKKIIFLHPVDLVDPFGHPPLWATSCSLPQPTGPRYGGLGVGEGNFEGWKPPKVGGCRWIRCAKNRVLSHVAQDMVYFWFGAADGGISGGFWGQFADILWS